MYHCFEPTDEELKKSNWISNDIRSILEHSLHANCTALVYRGVYTAKSFHSTPTTKYRDDATDKY